MASAIQSEIGGPGGRAGGERLAVVCNTGGSPERELTYLTLLQRQRAAAVVLTGGAVEDSAHVEAVGSKLRKLSAAGTRIVLCGRPPAPEAIALTFDNRGGAPAAHRASDRARAPAARVHRGPAGAHDDPAPAGGTPRGPGRRRRRGRPRLTVHGLYDRRAGYEATLELLCREPSLTAVVAANDTVALGACAALRDSGLRIPEDVSVAGFDDLPFAIDAVPALTTVRLPLAEAGARAGRVAMGREEPPPGGITTVGGELMVRGRRRPRGPPGGQAERGTGPAAAAAPWTAAGSRRTLPSYL